MLNSIIGFAVNNKLVMGLFTIALIGYGIYQFSKLPIDAVPDITNNQVQVITSAPAFGATDIERLVTFPIEQSNSNIPGLNEIRSFSRFGLSLVTLVFDDETDLYWARQQVAERLQKIQTQIPAQIGVPELGPVTTGLGEIYQYVIRPKPGYERQYDVTDLRTAQDWIVRRQLLGVKGVAEVSSFGGKLKQFSIEVVPDKLLSFGITIHDVFLAIEKNNQNTGGAYIEKGPTVLYIRSEGLLSNEQDIGNVSLQNEKNESLFLRDVANIKVGYATRYGAMCYNDEGEVAGAVVMMLKGANSNEVIKRVKARIAEIQRTMPEGLIIEPFLDRTKMVNNAIGTVKRNLLEGALIVVFVLVIFLGNLRAGLLVASVIPLSMLFAVIMMNIFGVSGNLMSLGALDFGLIVDGAVIIVEAVMHQVSRGRTVGAGLTISQAEMDTEVKQSAGRMMNSAVFAQVIILVVYLPIFSLQGIEGKMFKPMAQTVAFALLGAFILSLTYVPMMSALILSKKRKQAQGFSDKMMNNINFAYRFALLRVLRFPKTVLLTAVIIFIYSVFILSRLGGEFIPQLEEGDFAVDTRILTGSNLHTTIAYTQKAAGILKRDFPEVEKVVTKIGSGEVPIDPMPMEASDMMVILKPKSTWTSARSFPELSEKMSQSLSAIPGLTTGFQYPVQMRFNELMTGARQDVVCKVFGENLDTLTYYAHKIAAIINQVKGSKDIYVETVSGLPQITIRYNRSEIARYGIDIASVNRVVNTALAGESTGVLFEGEKRFDVVVRVSGDQKRNVNDIRNLLVSVGKGVQIPLYQLADVEIRQGPNQIQREDAKRRIVVGFNVRGRDVESIVNELEQKVNNTVKFPPGYYLTYGGAFENLKAAKKRLIIVVPISLLLIFILLYFAFNSVRQAVLIYSAIPLSAIGGILFLALRDMPFSISAGIGFIALFGVAVLNGIVLITEFNRIKKEGVEDVAEVVKIGTQHRLRPVLMTALVASLGFLPMAVSNGAGAEVQRPLATVVIGGLLVATFLTLFVLPVLYIQFEKGFRQPKVRLLILLLLCCSLQMISAPAQCQSIISLKDAIDTAIKNNLLVKNERLKVQYQQMLIKTAGTIPQAGIIAEVGQMNSIYTDTKFSFNQSFNFPAVYARQKKLYEEEWKAGTLNVSVKEKIIRQQVAQVFFLLAYFQQKKQVLLYSDSLYTNFFRSAELRLLKGESNVLEKSSAETSLGQIRLQLEELNQDMIVETLHFQLLLNSVRQYVPEPTAVKKMFPIIIADTNLISLHPQVQFIQQQQAIADASIKLEKSRLLPDLSVAYNNSSIIGFGADNKYYSSSKRFSAVQLGIGVPIFSKAQREKVKSARLNKIVTEQYYEAGLQSLQFEYQRAFTQYQKQIKTINYFESMGLRNADTIVETADRQLKNGDINFLQWVQLVNQAIAVKNDYTEAIKRMNDAAIALDYFSSK